jgi:hypothetical protein
MNANVKRLALSVALALGGMLMAGTAAEAGNGKNNNGQTAG